MGGWKLAGERLDKREDAETLLRIVNSDDFTFKILKADRKQQHDAPPRLYDLTGKEKYRKAIDLVYSQIEQMPRTAEGNFWHKNIYPNQVWLDGLYMCCLLYTSPSPRD